MISSRATGRSLRRGLRHASAQRWMIAGAVVWLTAILILHEVVIHGLAPAVHSTWLADLRLVVPMALIGFALPLFAFARNQGRRLRASELRFNRFFERSDPAIVVDLRSRCVVDANAGAVTLFGESRKALIGRAFDTLLHDEPTELADMFARLDEEGSAGLEQVRCQAAGGACVSTEVSATLTPEDDHLALLRFRNIDEHRRVQQALYFLAQSSTGPGEEDFVRSCVRELAQNYRVRWALAGIFTSESRQSIRTLAVWDTDEFVDNITYDLGGTPCSDVLFERVQLIEQGVRDEYPDDDLAREMGVESYLGAPLRSADGTTLGIVVVMDDKPMRRSNLLRSLIGIYAERLSQELRRRNALQEVRQREQNYRDLVDGSVQGIIIHRDWRPLYVNAQALRVFGYASIQQIFALPSLRVLFAEHELPRLERYRQARMRGEAAPDEYEIDAVRRDGAPIVVQNVVRLIRWEGEPAIQSTFLDVTRRRQTEAALRESEANFRRLADNSIEAILIHCDLKPLYVNPSFASTFGYSAKNLLTLASIEQLFSAESWPHFLALGGVRLREGEEPRVHLLEMCHRDGAPIEVQVRVTRTLWNGTEALQATMIDVTEQHQGERILRSLHEFSAQQELNFAERMQALLQTGCRYFGLSYGVLARTRGDEFEVLSAVTPDGSLREGDRLAMRDTYCGEALVRDEALLFADAHSAWPDTHPARSQSPWRSLAVIPLHVRDRIYGALAFANKEPRERAFGEGDERVLDLMGRWVAGELARREDERARHDSEQRFRDFAETSADWFWETDQNMRFRFFHGKNSDVIGVSTSEMIGLSRQQVYERFVENAEEALEEYREALRAQRPFHDVQLHWRRPDGQLRILSNSGRPVFDRHGGFTGYRGAGRDVTSQVLAREQLRQSEQRFRDYASVAADWFWETDAELRFTFVSKRHAELTNWPVEHFLGKTQQSAYADDGLEDSPQWQQALQDMRARRPYAVRIDTTRADGTPMIIFNQGIPVIDASGEFEGYRGIGRDITERVMTERELERHRNSLEELVHERTQRLEQAQKELLQQERLATIGRLVATVSHELRNPLGAVRNAAYYLQRKVSQHSPRLREQLGIIEKEINAADRIINDLLETTRAKVPVVQEIDLARLIEQVFDAFGAHPGIDFHVRCEPPDLRLAADMGHMRQVLLNLVTNSIQALRDRGSVSVRAAQSDELTCIYVSDDGPGIPRAHRDQIFEPLFTTKSKGNGLGLWLCRELVERHGGTLQLQPDDGAGATFAIALPRRRAVGVLAAAS